MGKATISSGGPDGNYQVNLDYGVATKTAHLAAIAERMAKLVGEIAKALEDLNFSEYNEAVAQSELDAAVDAYVAAAKIGVKELEAAMLVHMAALAKFVELRTNTDPFRIAWETLKSEQAQLEKDSARWTAMVLEETVQAWCADLTETATGSVATLEIPGENKLLLIAPAAPVPVADDGLLTAREVQTPEQVYFNAAVLPGWQKYKPTYRRGTVTAVDTEANTADVLLAEQDTSSAQELPINQADTLLAVPVQYMTCNARAFDVGDQCVVRFVDRDWAKPRVVGFVDHPKACPLYLESGQLSFSYPAPESPTRFDPAQWHFMDLSTGADWLGKITATGTQYPSQVLTEGQDSLAIGYPKSTTGTPEEKAAKDAARKEQYGETTATKKTLVGLFPASLFSGKMRLFMQAQYGAQETLPEKLALGLSGTSLTLIYVDNGVGVQIGFWSHLTTGIFRAPSGVYFLISLALAGDGSGTTVTYYPIALSPAATRIAKLYAAADDLTRDKIEAYIFAGCTVQTAKGKTISLVTGAKGGPLAYGWKFNADGSEARIVVHETLNAGLPTVRWKSSTVTVSLTYAEVDGLGSVYASAAAAVNGEWIDGWGTYNIFVPDTETVVAPLSLKSLRVGSPRKGTEFDFTNVLVYGYYDGDGWCGVTVSAEILTGPFPLRDWTSTNITYPAFFDPDVYMANRPVYGGVLADQGCSYEEHSIYSGSINTLTIGGHTHVGYTHTGGHVYLTKTVGVGTTQANAVNFVGASLGVSSMPIPPGYTDLGAGYSVVSANVVVTTTDFSGTVSLAWALVIPGGDCSAAYAGTLKSSTSGYYSKTVRVVNDGISRFTGPGYSFAPWAHPSGTTPNSWYGTYGSGNSVTAETTAPFEAEYALYASSGALSGVICTPGGSLSGLFEVAYTHPYYDRGMYTYTSHGLRYVLSEGLKSPSSAYYDRRFVGWA